jgi:hypothetical protein
MQAGSNEKRPVDMRGFAPQTVRFSNHFLVDLKLLAAA